MWDPTPWFVDGAEHSADVARTFAYAATGGAEGIIRPGDLKVQPLNVPGQAVRVAPGGVLMLNRYPGGAGQTYIGRNPVEHQVAVTPTGSAGGRSDLVVATVNDPQYPGTEEPTDPLNFQYMRTRIIEGVPAGTTSATALNLDYPAVALARIDFPASTGTVTSSMITDLRTLAMPRSKREIDMGNPAANMFDFNDTRVWPTWGPNVIVPEWATHIQMIYRIEGMTHIGGNEWIESYLRLSEYGGSRYIDGEKYAYDHDNSSKAKERTNFSVQLHKELPSWARGARLEIRLMTRRVSLDEPGRVGANAGTQCSADIWFEERAV